MNVMTKETPTSEVIDALCRCDQSALLVFVDQQSKLALPSIAAACETASRGHFRAHWRAPADAMRYKQPPDSREYLPADRKLLQQLLQVTHEDEAFTLLEPLSLDELNAYGYILAALRFAIKARVIAA